ncbi:MAG: peptidoglycan-associated lipoprotein Pal [Lysobacterales bacterium]|nr:peptidoglycan-associated lipoprotein Pal [Rhodanobacteraceae bacterium]
MNTPIRVLVIALALAGVACKKEVVKPEAPPQTPAPTQPTTAPAQEESWTNPALLDSKPCLVSRVAYFDLDQTTIKSEAMEMLRCHGKWLASNPGARISLEGHADERGSREYNLGLGERRGNAVRDMLLANGGRSEQVAVVSYGEERPICTDSDESCWSKNRRAEIVYTAKQ